MPTPEPSSVKLARFPHATLLEAVHDALMSAGMPDHIAKVEAEFMVESDLLGTASHGVRMLPRLLAGLRNGGVNASPSLRLSREFGATCVLEGDRGPGRFVSLQAMNHAVDRAKRLGVGACLAREVSH